MKNTTTTTTTRFDHSLYGLSDEDLKNKLTNRVVTYFNSDESTVKNDGVRQFVIKSIDRLDHAKGSGRRYIQGEVQDLDDGGKTKFRTLHVGGIEKVKSRLSTAVTLAKSVYLSKSIC
tara:strand:+ start:138 stop:491 length:354 start_codon:yes stop_codon:yes gene_type:complete